MEPLVIAPTMMAAHAVPTIALSALLAVAMLTAAALKGWQGWLSLKSRELDLRAGPAHHDSFEPDVGPATAARIELADLKERIRKLEAIASGVDL